MSRAQNPINSIFILIVVVLVIMASIGIILVLRDTFKSSEDNVDCAAEIASHAAIVKYTGGKAQPLITCPTKLVSIKTTNEDEVKKGVADEMKRCWQIWGQGKYDLFGRDEKGQEREGLYCHMCSIVTVTGINKVEQFPQYLDTHKATNKQTYAQYLSNSESGTYFSGSDFMSQSKTGTSKITDQDYNQKTSNGMLATDKPVAVLFIHTKGLTSYQRFYNGMVGNSATSATVGGLTGAAIATGAMYVVGTVISATGIGTPLGLTIIAAGTVIGAGTGLGVSFYGTEKPSNTNASVIIIRPLDDSVKNLGCQYDPVKN